MKILVKSKADMRKLFFSKPDLFKDKNNFFISISGIDHDWPFPLINQSHMLRVIFDDITDEEFESLHNNNLILFSEDDAKKIHDFVNFIPETDTLYVNCAAGISRSGAIGECLNEFFNNDNAEDFNFFLRNNRQIHPNPFVKRIFSAELFGQTDWNEIFK